MHPEREWKPVIVPESFDQLVEILKWRRDVRRFRPDPVDAELVGRLLSVSQMAPSVGYSQPWRFVLVESEQVRAELRANFEAENEAAAAEFEPELGGKYRGLKLSGLDVAPVQIAVFCDMATTTGKGLGKRTMAETLQYSVVMAIHTLWLAATAAGLGVGWVSILDPESATRCLEVPESWKLIALLCVGYAEEQSQVPELERLGWEKAEPAAGLVVRR